MTPEIKNVYAFFVHGRPDAAAFLAHVIIKIGGNRHAWSTSIQRASDLCVMISPAGLTGYVPRIPSQIQIVTAVDGKDSRIGGGSFPIQHGLALVPPDGFVVLILTAILMAEAVHLRGRAKEHASV